MLGIQQALGLHCQVFGLTARGLRKSVWGTAASAYSSGGWRSQAVSPSCPPHFQLGYPIRQWFSKDALQTPKAQEDVHKSVSKQRAPQRQINLYLSQPFHVHYNIVRRLFPRHCPPK